MIIYPSIVIGLGIVGKRITDALRDSIRFRIDDFPAIEVILYPEPILQGDEQEEEENARIFETPQNNTTRIEVRNKFIQSVQNFSRVFDNAMRKVTGFEAEKGIRKFYSELPPNRQQSVNIYIVGALCEPFCSGVFLDIAYLCRHHLKMRFGMESFSIDGLFTLTSEPSDINPDISNYETKPAAYIYAVLKELDYYCDLKEFSLDYLNPIPPPIKYRPFDRCYLFDTIKKNRFALPNKESLNPLMGEILFHLIFPPANEKINNPLTNDVLSSYFLDQKVKAYSGIGISSISFPRKDMLNGACCRYASEIIQFGLFSPEPSTSEVNQEVEDFEKNHGITGEHFLETHDGVQDKNVLFNIREDIGKNTNITNIQLKWYERDTLRVIENKIEELKVKFENQWQELIEDDRQEKIKKLDTLVSQKQSELLQSKRQDRQDKSLKFSLFFLKKLKDQIENRHHGTIEKKKNEHKEKSNQFSQEQATKRAIISNWYDKIPTKSQIYTGSAILFLFSFLICFLAINLYSGIKAIIAISVLGLAEVAIFICFWFYLHNKIIGLRNKIFDDIRKWFIEQVSEFRYSIDLELISDFANWLGKQIDQLDTFVKNLEQVEKDFKAEEEKTLSKLQEQSRFISDESILSWEELSKLYDEDKDLGKPEPSNRNPRQIENIENIHVWIDKSQDWLRIKLETIAKERVEKSPLSKLKVEELLKKKIPDLNDLIARFSQLLEDSSPIISCGDMELPTDNIQNRTIFGYYSGDDSTIEDALRQLRCEYNSISTKQCDQFLTISVSHGLPLCDINHLRFFKSEYEAFQDDKKPDLHIFKDIADDKYDVSYLKSPLEIQVERMCGTAICLGIIHWEEDTLKENSKVAVIFAKPNQIKLEGKRLQGSLLPLSLDPIFNSEAVFKRLDDEIKKMKEDMKSKDFILKLQQGLIEFPLTQIMKREVEYYLKNLGA